MEPLGELDCILMRKDPPFDTEYIYTTYVLERAEEQGALVVNRPQGLRDINEKVYTAWFPQCCAPTLITRDMADMEAFLREHGKIVCKPLHGMGGRSIFVLEQNDKNMNVVFETLTDYGQRFAIVQRYLPEIVDSGDSRVLLIDGEPVPYALARIPQPHDNRGNLAAGARGVGRPLKERDRWLAAQIGPALAAKGHAVRRARRHRRLRDGDQCHQPHRHPRAREAVSYRHRRPAHERDRAAARARSSRVAKRALMLREGRAPVWDRLLTMIFFVALLHGMVILGLTFNVAAGPQ